MFNTYSDYKGDLDIKKQLVIDCVIERIKSMQYQVGISKTKLDILDILKNSSGECFEYFAKKLCEDKTLADKYYYLVLEAGYQKQKEKKYPKFKKFKSSREIQEIETEGSMFSELDIRIGGIQQSRLSGMEKIIFESMKKDLDRIFQINSQSHKHIFFNKKTKRNWWNRLFGKK